MSSYLQNVMSMVNDNEYHIRDAIIGIGVVGGLFYAHSKIVSSSKRNRCQKAAQIKKNELLNTKHECFDEYKEMIKPEVESLILSLSATEIREMIIADKLKCSQVTLVICYHCCQCNKKLNAILEEHYDAAYKEALELDKLIQSKRNSSNKQDWIDFINDKQLLGIPISIKDLFKMKNSDSTIGLRRLCNMKYKEDGPFVALIREQGGIPYCKTNVPQLNMLPESINHIIGQTNNPYNKDFVAGGSSGGEAALVSCNASKLGIGTDIGGSLRSPAHFCGCIAYKPSAKRSPQTGRSLVDRSTYVNKFGIVASAGPLAQNMDDIIRCMKVLFSEKAQKLDPYMLPISWRDDIFKSKKKLRIGYWFDDGWFTSTKSVKRGIREAINVLNKEYEYEIVELPFKDGFKVLQNYFGYMGAESHMGEYLRALDDTEELYHGFKALKQIQDIPAWVKKYIVKPLMPLMGEHRKYKILDVTYPGDLPYDKFKDRCKQINKFRYEFWEWVDSFGTIDAIVCPTNFYPALTHDFSKNFMVTVTTTLLQNILDCAAGAYGPVTFVKKDECNYNLNDIPETERDSYSKELHGYMCKAVGLPIGVQVFSRPYDDEVVLRVMDDLDKYYKKPENKPKSLVNLITDK